MSTPVRKPSLRPLSELLAVGASDAFVRFPDEDDTPISVDELIALGLPILRGAASDGSALAVIMTNTVDCVATVLASISAGFTVVSIPPPARGRGRSAETALLLEAAAVHSGATVLVGEARVIDQISSEPSVVKSLSFAQARERSLGRSLPDGNGFRLVQHTSGSTGKPRAIALTDGQLGANVEAVLSVLELGSDEASCSWLPLSHDMGLVGMLLGSLVAPAVAGTSHVTCHLFRPESFLRRPAMWLRAATETKASITAAPAFALRHVLADRSAQSSLDLRQLRALIVGAEPLRVKSIVEFESAFRNMGLGRSAICPAYGMAEVGVAITMSSPSHPWQREMVPTPFGAIESVGCGHALPGYHVALSQAEKSWGSIAVRGPSLGSTYLDGAPLAGPEGWFETGDVGSVADGELVILGRQDDVLVLRGRSHMATELDDAICSIVGVRNGFGVAVGLPDGRLVAVVVADKRDSGTTQDLLRSVSRAVTLACGVKPDDVLAVGRSQIPRTASGKVQRLALGIRIQQEVIKLRGSLSGTLDRS